MYAASIFFTIVCAFFAAATPNNHTIRDGNGQCASGKLTCCDNSLSPQEAQGPLGQLGLGDLLNGASGQVGLQCNPITVIGTGQGATCTQEPLCSDLQNGLISLGCTPVNAAA